MKKIEIGSLARLLACLIVAMILIGNVPPLQRVSLPGVSAQADTEPPLYSEPSVDATTAGQPAEFSLHWTDNVGLDEYTFGFDNGTGTFVDDPPVQFTEGGSGGEWWDPAWIYRQAITIDNALGSEPLANYPVLIVVDTATLIAAGKLNAHGGDLRFIAAGAELDFWVESGMGTASTRIWIEVPQIPAASTTEVVMYYGNVERTVPRSDGSDTFWSFDDFGGRGWEEYKYSNNPVMGPGSSAGGSGTFASVWRESDTLWRMYASYDSDNRDIGLSTSSDGLAWSHQGVVLRKGASGEWDASNVWCPAVWKEGATYYMLYAGSGPGGTQMGLATSLDGVNFQKHPSNPVFQDPDWASGDTEGPCFSALKEGGTYYVMYNTLGHTPRQSSIVASTDLLNWTRVYNYPRFPGGGTSAAWNYNTFCGNMFKYEDLFYLVIPGQDSSRNYAKFGLYVSSSPTFPETDTEFKGIVMVGDPAGWEDEDMDTPWAVLSGDMLHLYYAACGSCWSQTGAAIVNDIPFALTQAYPPGNYIGVNRSATASQQVMPPVGWQKSIPGYVELDDQNLEITLDPAVAGRAVVLYDGNAVELLELSRDFAGLQRGTLSAWMRTDNAGTGHYDLYAHGDSQASMALAAGMDTNGRFHYWNGGFVDTGVAYTPDTWYLFEVDFEVAGDTYDLTIYDTDMSQLLRVDDVGFETPIASGLDRISFQTSGAFSGYAYLDQVVIREKAPIEPALTLGAEETPIFTDAWSRVTKTLNAAPGTTIRWRFSAVDTSGNWTTSDIYSFVTTVEDTPPTVVLNAPPDDHWAESMPVDFRTTCSDEYDVSEVSLYGDWIGAWGQVDTITGPGLNGTQLSFPEAVPDGTWTWNVLCRDDTGNEAWGTARTLNVDTDPDTWWHSNYHYRQRLVVHENAGQALTDYPMHAILDTAALIAAGKMQPDCDDVRVVYHGIEVASQLMGCNTTETKLWLQTDLAPSESRQGFYLYYGYPSATAPDYTALSSLTWNNATFTMDTGRITATFYPAGGIISQIWHNANGQPLLGSFDERGLGYLFGENPALWYIFRADETDDSIALTVDGPIVKIVTAYSGESPQWVQDNVFYNGSDFVDFQAFRPPSTPSERFLAGANIIAPDGVFNTGETNELLRVDDATVDTPVTFDEVWRFAPTPNRGYVGVSAPDFATELALLWDKSVITDFTWKPRSAGMGAGSYSLFVGGNGTVPVYGTIDADSFEYRFMLRHDDAPDNAHTQLLYDSYVTAPPTVSFGPEEYQDVDTTPPVVTILSPVSTTYDRPSVPLRFSVSEAAAWCGYSLDGGATVDLPGCDETTLENLDNGSHDLTVYAHDYAGNSGEDSVTFEIDVEPFAWWDPDWGYRISITVDATDYDRVDQPVEHIIDFTQAWADLGIGGLSLDTNAIRVVEYTAAGGVLDEVPSQFEPAAGFDPTTNAVGTVVWIMDGSTMAHGTRHYYIYFDSTGDPKPPPAYSTDLNWDATNHTLANAHFEATLGTVLSSSLYRTGIMSLRYDDVTYTAAGGTGIYYVGSPQAGPVEYEALSDGPVKKTIRVTAPTNGEIRFTLYDRAVSIGAAGSITGSPWSFAPFPYAHSLSAAALSNHLHYFNAGVVVNETVTTQSWLNDTPDEGWACYDGLGTNPDFCLVTDAATLLSANNLWRYSTASAHQLIFPGWNPNPPATIEPTSWIVMGETYQDGRDFWNRLSSPISIAQGDPEAYTPTAVTLTSFEAKPGAGHIALTWETATELENLGFNLYRSDHASGPYTRLNDVLIPSRAPGLPTGATYEWIDDAVTSDVTYYYRLEAEDVRGRLAHFGPVSAAAARLVRFVYLPLVTK